MKEPGDYTIAAIERGEAIPKLAFRAAELRGNLAPHVFVENPANAICQDCGIEILFEEKDARTTTHRTDEMGVLRKIAALRAECHADKPGFFKSNEWDRGARQIIRDHGLSLTDWYLLCSMELVQKIEAEGR